MYFSSADKVQRFIFDITIYLPWLDILNSYNKYLNNQYSSLSLSLSPFESQSGRSTTWDVRPPTTRIERVYDLPGQDSSGLHESGGHNYTDSVTFRKEFMDGYLTNNVRQDLSFMR